MKRCWNEQELVEHWTLFEAETESEPGTDHGFGDTNEMPSSAVLPVARLPSQVHDGQDLNAHAIPKDHGIGKGLELALADAGFDLPVDVWVKIDATQSRKGAKQKRGQVQFIHNCNSPCPPTSADGGSSGFLGLPRLRNSRRWAVIA